MTTFLARLKKDKTGATLIEYGLIAALVSVVAIAALSQIGTGVQNALTDIANCVADPSNCQDS